MASDGVYELRGQPGDGLRGQSDGLLGGRR